VYSAEADRYWCVYSAQCRVRLLLVCVQCAVRSQAPIGVCTVHVQSETVIGVCTVHVHNETVIGMCTVHSAEGDCFWCVYSAQCRVRLLLVCVQCTVLSETDLVCV